MFRVHQFDKVEMFVYCEPERSRDEHERLLEIEEELVQELGLPYRVLNIAAGDLGASAAKKYDIEAWFPGQARYREITSTSNTTDYQARRLNIRFRRDGKLEHVAHAERHGGHGARDDRDPRELPGRRRLDRGAHRAARVRRAREARRRALPSLTPPRVICLTLASRLDDERALAVTTAQRGGTVSALNRRRGGTPGRVHGGLNRENAAPVDNGPVLG